MAERQTPPTRRSSGDRERRQAPLREEDERRQAVPRDGGERRQAPPRDGGERRQAVPRDGGERRQAVPRDGGERRQAVPRDGGERRQTSSRRTDVIRCENCGEDYSITYKRCPFCDERPGRGGIGGKRVANTRGGGYGRPVNPIQVAGLVISLILIISALFIVFRFIGAPLIHGGKTPGSQGSAGTSQSNGGSQSQPGGTSQQPGGSQSQPGGSSAQPGGSTVPPPQQPDDPQPPVSASVQSIKLNKTDMTLNPNEKTRLTATLSPAGASGTIAWSSSNTAIATVDASGNVTNVNTGTKKVSVTITAACGDVKAECIARCKPKNGTADPGTADPGPDDNVTIIQTTTGTVTNAQDGLRVRSGPGTTYDRIGSLDNGSKVTIQGEENGWYKIDYKGRVGYVSKEYVSAG